MPIGRQATLQSFLSATEAALAARVGANPVAAAALQRVSSALTTPAAQRSSPTPALLPACEHLTAAIDAAKRGPSDLGPIADAVSALVPELAWRRRSGGDDAFQLGHANVDIVGPATDALEQRPDVRVGISLLAPNVTYPDHRHPPEEIYLVLSDGDWRQDDGAWHTPGCGGIVYNPPDIIHAMRARQAALLAIWCLPLP